MGVAVFPRNTVTCHKFNSWGIYLVEYDTTIGSSHSNYTHKVVGEISKLVNVLPSNGFSSLHIWHHHNNSTHYIVEHTDQIAGIMHIRIGDSSGVEYSKYLTEYTDTWWSHFLRQGNHFKDCALYMFPSVSNPNPLNSGRVVEASAST